jgi:hypothetical protein
MAEGPQRIHPDFQQIFEQHAEGFEFEPGARRLVMRLLMRGTEAFAETEEGGQDEGLEEAKSRLDQAMSAVADELHSRGITVVDETSLSLLMRAQCPLPPFCNEQGSSPGTSSSQDPHVEEMRQPASAGLK